MVTRAALWGPLPPTASDQLGRGAQEPRRAAKQLLSAEFRDML